MSETIATLGQIITTPQQRDAIHIAVAPVVAAYELAPGTHVGFEAGKREAVDCTHSKRLNGPAAVGVVDPFLKQNVQPGQTFWLYLNPGSITSLRHDWTHPAFGMQAPSEAETYLRDFASELGSRFEDMIAAAQDGHFCLPEDIDNYSMELSDEFWSHYTAYTGRARPGNAPEYFRCAC